MTTDTPNGFRPTLIASDLEGVFLPEIWEAVAEATQIEALQLTTKDIKDYDKLMTIRLSALREQDLTMRDVQQVIASMEPLPGAREMIDWLRQRTRLVILTDSFTQFIWPFLPQLGYPTIFSHELEVDGRDHIVGYHLRTHDNKRRAVQGFRDNGLRVMAIGDSYNDTKMLGAADFGALFCPPQNVETEFPHFPVARNYDDFRSLATTFLEMAQHEQS